MQTAQAGGCGRSRGPVRGFTLIEIMIVIALIAILSTIMLPNAVRMRSQGRLTACKTNLKNLATATESYSASHGNRYPTTLNVLTPSYIQSIPTCPSSGKREQYIAGFSSASNPDAYTLMCTGTYHGELRLPQNFPQYHSSTGLIER